MINFESCIVLAYIAYPHQPYSCTTFSPVRTGKAMMNLEFLYKIWWDYVWWGYDMSRSRKIRLVGERWMPIFSSHKISILSQTFSVDIFFAQKWQDRRLNIPNDTAKNRLIDVEWINHFWRPDTYFRSAKSVQLQTITVPNHYLKLYKDNTIKYTMKLVLELSCEMNFALYPHDTQKCKIRIESCKHT